MINQEDLLKKVALDALPKLMYPADLKKGVGQFMLAVEGKTYKVSAMRTKEADGTSNEIWDVTVTEANPK